MEKILEDCRDRKVSLSYLAPFSYPFYRRYGYEQSFDKISYQLNSRDVPFIKKKSGKIKRMDFEDAKAAIRRIYEQMPENQRAGSKREDWWYTYNLSKKAITSLLCILMIMRKQRDISFISLQRLPLLLRSGDFWIMMLFAALFAS